MRAVITLEMQLTDDDERPLDAAALRDALETTEAAIRTRLFGEGFLPGDVLVDTYTIRTSVVD